MFFDAESNDSIPVSMLPKVLAEKNVRVESRIL
jgi:hypothetical protein